MPSQRQIYTRKLDEITRQYLARENGLVNKGVELLRALQKDIAGEIALASGDFETYRLKALQENIAQQLASLESQLVSGMEQAAGQVYTDGGLAVVAPLQAVGYDNVFFSPSQAQILAVSDFSADLIRGLTSELLTKINTQLRRAALGAIAPFDIMKEITRILGFQGKMITGGIAQRVEVIVRTELARIFNLSKHNTQQDAGKYVPDLLKRWVATGDSRTRPEHLEAHREYADNPIPVNEPFIVGGEELDYPGDPKGSPAMVINCRCTTVQVVPEIGILSSPLDDAVRKRLDELASEAETA